MQLSWRGSNNSDSDGATELQRKAGDTLGCPRATSGWRDGQPLHQPRSTTTAGLPLCNASRRPNHDDQKIRSWMLLILLKELQGSLKTLLLETSQAAMPFSLPSHTSSAANSSFPRQTAHSNTTIPGLIAALFSLPASWSGYVPSIPAMLQLFLLCLHSDIIISSNTEQILSHIAPKALIFGKSPIVLNSALFLWIN